MTTTPKGIELAHDDHGLGAEHLAFIDEVLKDWDGEFTIRVNHMPDSCPDLLSALYGPSCGDEPVNELEVEYEKRNDRPGPSRLVDLPHRPVRGMVVIAGPGQDGPVVYTAYGCSTAAKAPAPREWWDAGMKPSEALESAAFWMTHALAR